MKLEKWIAFVRQRTLQKAYSLKGQCVPMRFYLGLYWQNAHDSSIDFSKLKLVCKAIHHILRSSDASIVFHGLISTLINTRQIFAALKCVEIWLICARSRISNITWTFIEVELSHSLVTHRSDIAGEALRVVVVAETIFDPARVSSIHSYPHTEVDVFRLEWNMRWLEDHLINSN